MPKYPTIGQIYSEETKFTL